MSKPGSFVRMLVPSTIVFFASACIMILELVASRLVARDLGSSLYTWTAIIGVVLAGISLGNYLGGRLADRYHARRALAVLFGLSSAACVATVILNNVVGACTWLWYLSWPTHVFLHVSLVFLVPSTLLGTIGPVAAKMALDQGLAAGRTIGGIYAWGAAGSIAGTFFAGFFLMAKFGSVIIIWSIGAALLAMALFFWLSCWAMYLWAMIFAALATMGMAPEPWARSAGVSALLRRPVDPNVILYEDETPYCHVEVRRVSQRPEIRAFWQDQLKHSEVVMDDVTSLQYFYTEIYAALTRGMSRGKDHLSMMVIGGGGYVFPRYLKTVWPASDVEVVEIDPGVTRAAQAAFGLDERAGIRTINLDARNYVDQLLQQEHAAGPPKRYDFIYEDAINDYSVPFQLVTKEFNEKIAQLLTDDGLYLVNLIDTYENGQFAGAVLCTLEQTFPCVQVISNRTHLPSLRDTFVVVASRQRFDAAALLAGRSRQRQFWLLDDTEKAHLRSQCGDLILTDDYAPVENLLAPVVRQGARERLALKYLQKAEELQAEGNLRQGQSGPAAALYEQSIAQYRRALVLNPSMGIKAFNEIGMMRVAQGRLDEAVVAFRSAIQAHAESGGQQTAVASVHMNLGILLGRMNRAQEAKEQLTKAAEWFRTELADNSNSVTAWDWLGDTLATLKDFKGASNAFAKAAALEPQNPTHYEKLARALEFQGRYAEALDAARNQVKLLQELGRPDLAKRLGEYIELLEYKKVKQSRGS
jgi:predicted membrane-bound spermidine synthase/Tfp pilus assembly protein PilF